MSTPTQAATLPVITEEAVTREAEKFIQAACQKHGISRDQLTAEAVADARRIAREGLETNARNQSDPNYLAYQESKREIESLRSQLNAIKENREARTDTRVVQSFDRTRALMGMAQWQQLSEAQRVSALGVDPASVDREQLKRLFGKDSSSVYATDFMKTSPYRYRQLKEVALALNITGK